MGDKLIKEICLDSRKVEKGSLFIALKGAESDGHNFIGSAIENGAVAIVYEQEIEEVVDDVTYVKVHSSRKALAEICKTFFEDPTKEIELIGVTGTNGKTTVSSLLHSLYTEMGYKAGLISTIRLKYPGFDEEARLTTPDQITLYGTLRKMADAGCSHVFMEVSSHAIDQERIGGLEFRMGVFTNISHDHLDYHGSFKEYIGAKKKFFDKLPEKAFALVNADDKNGKVMVQNSAATIKKIAIRSEADFRARILENTINGMLLQIDSDQLYSPMTGAFNAYNLLTVFAAAILMGEDKEEVLTRLSALQSPEGRLEWTRDAKIVGVVDYAHTPDALKKVLETLNDLSEKQRVLTVVGCGGDRDASKRPKMGKIAARLSDVAILTSDNPRGEDPTLIIEQMMEGIGGKSLDRVYTIPDRRRAIRMAVKLASAGDIILIAGKGHEKYQEIKGKKHPFDDMQILKEELRKI